MPVTDGTSVIQEVSSLTYSVSTLPATVPTAVASRYLVLQGETAM